MRVADSLSCVPPVVPHKAISGLHEASGVCEAAGNLRTRKIRRRFDHFRQRIEVPDRHDQQMNGSL